MKTDFLKKLIKEAVREAIQEEIKDILLEAVRSPKTVVQESHTPTNNSYMTPTQQKTGITPDIKRNLRAMIGGEFDTTITATSAMAQPTYTPPPVNTVGDGSSLPPGEVNLNQILNLMNK
jgi:hypothetical protein